MTGLTEFLSQLAVQDAVLVTVRAHRGSVPRDCGAWMAVFADTLLGTIGGGHLEWQAIQEARSHLAGGLAQSQLRYALGPTLGQCCGGEVVLYFERVSAQDVPNLTQRLTLNMAAWPQVALFGGGHVGRALVRVLGALPLRLQWIDSRDEIFPNDVPAHVRCEHSQPVHDAVRTLDAQSLVVVMSFSHAEDLNVVAACLMRQRERGDVPFIGLIGSQTKWASFSHRLLERGFSAQELAQVTCPIGAPGISGKEPEVIAIAVAAQLLQVVPKVDIVSGHMKKENDGKLLS